MEEEWYNQSNEDNLREQLQELESKVLKFKEKLIEYVNTLDNTGTEEEGEHLLKQYKKYFNIK